MAEEIAIIGWKPIAEMFNCSERKMRNYKQELLDSGVIFFMNLGRPPRRRVLAFPSRLKKWAGRKGFQREVI